MFPYPRSHFPLFSCGGYRPRPLSELQSCRKWPGSLGHFRVQCCLVNILCEIYVGCSGWSLLCHMSWRVLHKWGSWTNSRWVRRDRGSCSADKLVAMPEIQKQPEKALLQMLCFLPFQGSSSNVCLHLENVIGICFECYSITRYRRLWIT